LHFGENSLQHFNQIALQGLDDLREYLGGKLIVNNWFWNGVYQWSGFRPKTCEIGATYSQHRLGNAFDIKPAGMLPGELYRKILDSQDHEKLKNITSLEDIEFTPTWVHVDFRNIPERIKIVKP